MFAALPPYTASTGAYKTSAYKTAFSEKIKAAAY
jgi:hypothetical protein